MSKFNVENEKPMEGLEQFQGEFLTDREKECEYLHSFHEQGDIDAIAKMAHKWKGIAAPYGFVALEQLSKDLEAACRESDLNNCLRTIKMIESYLEDKRKFIEG